VYFRLTLGGITGHKDFARDTGVLLKPEECLPVAVAVLRVFIDNGDRTDRKKARMKYLLDKWGFEKYLAETAKHLSFPLRRFELEDCEPRPQVNKHGHIGVFPQKQPGRSYIGVQLPVGRLLPKQMRGLADIADRFGSRVLRLTVWQNLIISDIPDEKIDDVKQALTDLGLHWSAGHVTGGLVACTGAAGCKYAAAHTKTHALKIGEHLESTLELDHPVNIHVTGCPHSCAQHYIGDIGLLGTKVAIGDDMIEGYHIFVGGGYGASQVIARELFRDVIAEDAPQIIERMLRAYMDSRSGVEESFLSFVTRHDTPELKRIFERQAVPV
jgi:ferredoxin-nitrite reductase